MLLDDNINHEKLKKMNTAQLSSLCNEIRRKIFRTVMKNGGHLSSNLGAVELAVALHYVYDVNGSDRVIWDVGHQAYAHKLLTGRFSRFDTLRRKGGISGFTRNSESPADAFIAGHASTSVSAAYGISTAMRLEGSDGAVAAVIGDGALTGGMAYEALNNAGKTASNLTLIINDNAMSIGKSTGALARYLAHIRSTRRYYRTKERVKSALSGVPIVGKPIEGAIINVKSLIKDALYDSSNMFENLGFAYIGPVDGHNIGDMIEALLTAKLMKKPCVVHVFTRKGKGYKPAEANPGEYHAVAPGGVVEEFTYDDPTRTAKSFSEVCGRELAELGKSDSRICAITAAMKYATGLNYFKDECPSRFFDTGIAEEHSVTFAAGLSAGGMLPVFAVYSTFLQRGFDQIIHDCAIEKTHITLCIDRAGFVGADGETHQGIFDVPMLRAIPNTVIYCPATFEELRCCIRTAIYNTEGVACVRYPKGGEFTISDESGTLAMNPSTGYFYSGKHSKTLGITYGRISANLIQAASETGADYVRLVCVNPLPESVYEIATDYRRVVFFEEGSLRGGAAEGFLAELCSRGFRGSAEIVGVRDEFVPAAEISEQLEMYGLDVRGMAEKLRG